MTDFDSTTTGRVEIDLGALVRNYKLLTTRAAQAECAATVKANAYGHGVDLVVPALLEAGCTTFFVATPREGAEVRRLSPNAAIYILNGLLPGTTAFYLRHQLQPVLGDLNELKEWTIATNQPAGLHVDTGMNRSGMSPNEVTQLASDTTGLLERMNINLVMSHFACADEPDHPLNDRQRRLFEGARALFPNARASVANSAATLSAPLTHHDVVRPGISLYGGRAIEGQNNPTEPVARMFARIIKIRDNWAVDTIGYGASHSLANVTRVATVAIGYADGFSRHLSVADGDEKTYVWCAGRHVPVIGRISMDLTTIDISSLPLDAVKRGDMIEIYGPNNNVDDLADRAGTMGYEFLTQLSRRFPRIAIKSEAPS